VASWVSASAWAWFRIKNSRNKDDPGRGYIF
jgi:hypothetical protein